MGRSRQKMKGIAARRTANVVNYIRPRRAVLMPTNRDSIYLLTETAKPYFEKRSYTIVERDNTPDVIRRSSEFSHVCPVTAVVMKKTLDK